MGLSVADAGKSDTVGADFRHPRELAIRDLRARSQPDAPSPRHPSATQPQPELLRWRGATAWRGSWA